MELSVLEAVETGENASGSARLKPLAPTLIPGWRCISPAIVRAAGEEGFIDLVALHPARGVALVALLDADEEASPDEACAAFRAMLAEAGFAARFRGELPVVAVAERRSAAERLAAAVERRFAPLPRLTLDPDWVEWVAAQLGPSPVADAPAIIVERVEAPPRPPALPPRAEAPLSAPPPVIAASPPAHALSPPAEAPLPAAPPVAEALPLPLTVEHEEPPPAAESPLPPLTAERDAPPLTADAPALTAARDETPPPPATVLLSAEREVPAPVVALVSPSAEDVPALSAELEPAPGRQRSWLDYGGSMGFALGLVLVLLAGLVALIETGRIP
jgi:hypothetical protein